LRVLLRVLLLNAWAFAALLAGIASGVTRTDLLLVVPATVMLTSLVTSGGALLGARPLALTLTGGSAALLALLTWGPIVGAVLVVSAVVVADQVTSFLRPPGREGNRPVSGLTKGNT
jgi:hypothetical protein